MPALQARLCHALVLQVGIAQREEMVSGRARPPGSRRAQSGTYSLPGSRRCCGGTLPRGAGTTYWTDLAAPHQKNPIRFAESSAGRTRAASRRRAPAEAQRR